MVIRLIMDGWLLGNFLVVEVMVCSVVLLVFVVGWSMDDVGLWKFDGCGGWFGGCFMESYWLELFVIIL